MVQGGVAQRGLACARFQGRGDTLRQGEGDCIKLAPIPLAKASYKVKPRVSTKELPPKGTDQGGVKFGVI